MSSDQKDFSSIEDEIRRLEDRIERCEERQDGLRKELKEERKCRLFEINGSDSHRQRVEYLEERFWKRDDSYCNEIQGYKTKIRQLQGKE